MYELLTQIIGHLYGMWRYRWYALGMAWFVSVGGWLFVYSMPDQYTASARVYVDTDSALRPLLRGLAVQNNVMGQVNLMTRALLSRPHLEKVARQTDLDLRARTPQEMENLIDQMRDKVGISAGREANLFQIGYTDRDRAMARAVVQAMLDAFVEDTLGASRTGSNNAQKFLDVQIADYEKRLAEAEERLAEFKKKNVGRMPSDGQDYYSRLQLAIETLNRTESERRVAENRVSELRSQLEGEAPVFGLAPSPTQQVVRHRLDDKIRDYENQIDKLSLQYTDRHPDIVALRETLDQMRATRDKELAENPPPVATESRGIEQNPVYQSLKIALSQAEVELREVRARERQQRDRVEGLRRLVDTIPEIEAELKRLNRDYEVNRTQYQELLQRREVARLSDQASEMGDEVQFRIIEPPAVPIEPAGPNRLLYFAVVFLAALGAGAGVAFVFYQLKPVYFTAQSIRDSLQLPVLGAVSRVWTGRQKRTLRLKSISFAVGLACLVATFIGVVVFEDIGVRLIGSTLQKVIL